MRTHARLLAAGVLVPALACWLPAAGDQPGAPVLPATALTVVVKEAVRNIETGLRKPADKMAAKRIRANACMVALAAQDAMLNKGPDAGRLATLRDAAIRLAKAAAGKRVDQAEAKKETTVLASFPNIQPAADAKIAPVDLRADFDIADVMRVFDKANKGGQGIEVQLITLQSQKRPYTPRQMADFEMNAYKTAMIAALARAQDDKATTPADKAQWRQWSDETRKFSLELVQAARAKDSRHFKTVVNKLNESCAACHDKFK